MRPEGSLRAQSWGLTLETVPSIPRHFISPKEIPVTETPGHMLGTVIIPFLQRETEAEMRENS